LAAWAAVASGTTNFRKISASCQKVFEGKNRTFFEILKDESQTADLVFLGMATPGDKFTQYYEQMQQRLSHLPATILVLASPDFDYQSVLGES
jgi:hypothetical protein